MSNIPSQIRTVDPYASYHSNITNRLTRIVSRGEDIILGTDSVTLSIIDSTAAINDTEILLSTGYTIKDDVLIIFDTQTTIDMTNSDFYRSGSTAWNETGIYYIVIDYIYQRTKPAPQAGIILLKPSETDLISQDRYMFIGAALVEDVGGGLLSVTKIYNTDPNDSSITRNYGATFDLSNQIIDELKNFGIYVNESREFVGQCIDVEPDFDTTNAVEQYDLVYKNPDDNVYYKALADGTIKQVGVGVADVENDRVVFVGLIRTNLTFDPGDDLFLSDIDEGEFTTTSTLLQVGQCIDDNGLIIINIGAGGGSGQGDPYLSRLYLDNNRTFTVPSNYGAVVPDRYEVEDGSELVVEDDAVFTVV